MPLKLRLSLRFWLSYAPASGFITICCALIVRKWGVETLGATIILKALTNAVIAFVVNEYQCQRLYYYHNHGLSRNALWKRTLGIDAAAYLITIIPAAL